MVEVEARRAKGAYVYDGEVYVVKEVRDGEYVQEATGLTPGEPSP